MGIEKVVIKKDNFAHEDDRRVIREVFNNNGFCAKQVKVAEVKNKDSILGNHFHEYGELFYMLKGEGNFTLEDVGSKKREEYQIKVGESIFIPERVAHKVKLTKNAILIGATEEPYISPEHNDKKYVIE